MNSQKICNFFVSEAHLLTAVLPYINEKILEDKNIELVLQNDMTTNVKEYLNKVKSLNVDKEKVLKLNWKKTEKININDKEIIIIIGDEEFIKKVNKMINISDMTEEILNCYKIYSVEQVNEILYEYDEMLSTDGKNKIYKNLQNVQKGRTIQTQILNNI